MLYRILGQTGERVSAIGIGGYHLGNAKDEAESTSIVHAAIDAGITFMDNCWDYHDGLSEMRMGRALKGGYRDRVFLMTKIDGRDERTAARQIDESLRRLQTDRIDLLQFHEVIRMSDADRIFSPHGALQAALKAQASGKIRYIGFTGHKSPDIHLHMLRVADAHGFQFATVQMPLNLLDTHYNSFEQKVLPVAVNKGMGVLGMKPICAGKLMETKTVSAIECLHYAMSLPTSVVITGCDSMQILHQALDAVASFEQLSEIQMDALRARTASVARLGKFEEYKTTQVHDSTSQHPQWLGAA